MTNQIRLFYLSGEEYSHLAKIDPLALYFVYDELRIYRGSVSYSHPFELVTEAPMAETARPGTIYIKIPENGIYALVNGEIAEIGSSRLSLMLMGEDPILATALNFNSKLWMVEETAESVNLDLNVDMLEAELSVSVNANEVRYDEIPYAPDLSAAILAATENPDIVQYFSAIDLLPLSGSNGEIWYCLDGLGAVITGLISPEDSKYLDIAGVLNLSSGYEARLFLQDGTTQISSSEVAWSVNYKTGQVIFPPNKTPKDLELVDDNSAGAIKISLFKYVGQTIGDKIMSLEQTTGGAEIQWKINDQSADENGNFNITPEMVGAAPSDHGHIMADIDGLAEEFASKSPVGHSHDLVSGIAVEGVEQSPITSTAIVKGSSHLLVTADGNTINLQALPYSLIMSESLKNIANGTDDVKMFIGTTVEWEAFVKDPAIQYMVMLTD
jgi:hypothetical protein